MTFLAPWALWFAAAGAAVVALYLLKIKRRAQTVPALDFWLQLAGRTKVHSLLERLKRILSLLLWLAIVACLVMALGNPILSMGRIKPRAIVIVLDNSASMQTLEEGGKTRLSLASDVVQSLTTRRPVNDQWLLIEAASQPRVLQPWTLDGKAVRKAASAATPFAGSGDLPGAIDLARQLLADKPEPTIVVISDGAGGILADTGISQTPAARAAAPSPQDSALHTPHSPLTTIHWPVGATRDNLGITRLAVRPHRQDGNYHALIAIANASDERVETQLTLQIDGSTHSVELVTAEPGSLWEKTITIDAPAGGILRASLDRPDALTLDNEAYAVLEPIRPSVVWLVTPPDQAFFFEHALGSMDHLVWAEESLTLAPDQYEQAAAALSAVGQASRLPESAPQLRRPDVVVFNNCAPAALPASGRFIFTNAWPKEIPATIAGAVATPQLFLSPRPHPLTQHVTLQGVRLARAHRVSLAGQAKVLAHTPDGDPLLFLVDQPDRQSLCIAFDVLESDMPFRNAFPLLLRNAIAFMQSESSSWLRPEYRIGDAIEPLRPLPADLKQASLSITRGAATTSLPLALEDRRFRFTDTFTAGALSLSVGQASRLPGGDDEDVALAAINLADPRESQIQPATAEDPTEQLALSGRLFGTLPWLALAALAAGFITLEWLTYHFRWTE